MNKESAFTYRVYYEDTDAGGVVYYANYLKFFERARTDFLRQNNIVQSELIANHNLCFVVKECQINYLKSAILDDLISVSVKILKIGKASVKMYQEISREIAGDTQILCKMTIEIVSINSKTSKPVKIPTLITSNL